MPSSSHYHPSAVRLAPRRSQTLRRTSRRTMRTYHHTSIMYPLKLYGRAPLVQVNEDVVVRFTERDDHEHIPAILAPRALGLVSVGPASFMFVSLTLIPGITLQTRWRHKSRFHLAPLLALQYF
ncbi:hypothetical protein BXZ70DRAFT_921611, partial [Cristinia sonorae]